MKAFLFAVKEIPHRSKIEALGRKVGQWRFVCLASIMLLTHSSFSQERTLFSSDKILTITLQGETRSLLNDRSDDAEYVPLQLRYSDDEGQDFDISIRSKVRGNFRRKKENCRTPPIWLNFDDEQTDSSSIFFGQNKIKLVTPCIQDRYILAEYLAYTVYNLFTEYSFRARLVQVVFHDISKGPSKPMLCFLLEDEDEMAARSDCKIFKHDGLRPKSTKKQEFLRMAVFQYMIGNTDWSVEYRHNVKLLVNPTIQLPIPVPYDFDHAGIVNAPYANPAPELLLSSVRERRYRGYCLPNLGMVEPILKEFMDLRSKIYAVYEDNALIDDRYRKWVLAFLDQFYDTIGSPNSYEKMFNYPCKNPETSRIVIQGLNK